MLGGEQHGRAVVGREEAHAGFGHGGEFEQGHHLEAAAVRQDVVGPGLQGVGAAQGVEHGLTWFETEVVGVV